jgi:hypothetical protein
MFDGLSSHGSASGDHGNPQHRTPNSSIAKLTSWAHLAEDIAQAWKDETIISQRRCNLAGFIARLIALGINTTTTDGLAALAVSHLQQHLGSAKETMRSDEPRSQILEDNIHIAATFAKYYDHVIVTREPSEAVRRGWDENLTALQQDPISRSEDDTGLHSTLQNDARLTQSWLRRWATTLHLGEPCW